MALENLIHITRRCLQSSCARSLLNPGLQILWGRSYSQLSDQDGKTTNVAPLLTPALKSRSFRAVQAAIDRERLVEFLLEKGADTSTIESILTRNPHAATSCSKDLAGTWAMWQSILETDSAVLKVVKRSPHSFFRSGGVEKLSENISFLQSIDLTPKTLHQLMSRSPRTFANTVQLNKRTVSFLEMLCVRLGGEHPQKFVRQVITSNVFILTTSIRRLQANIECIQSLMKLEDKELLLWLEEKGACILDICNKYIEKDFLHIQEIMQSLGFLETEVIRYISENPHVFRQSSTNLNCKVKLLVGCKIDVRKIFDIPLYLNSSLETLKYRVKVLEKVGYDYRRNGPNILITSQAQFVSRLEKLSSLTSKGAKS